MNAQTAKEQQNQNHLPLKYQHLTFLQNALQKLLPFSRHADVSTREDMAVLRGRQKVSTTEDE